MSEISNKATLYFNAPKGYFWRWSENAEIIEWSDGLTIAYREELTTLLKEVSASCEPKRLGAVLLVLAACRDDWKEATRYVILYKLIKTIVENRGDEYEVVHKGTKEVFEFLDRINALVSDVRKGKGKILLLKQLFVEEINTFKPNSLKEYIDEFASGRLDNKLVGLREHSPEHLKADLAPLYRLSSIYSDVQGLEIKILTGLDILPQPIEIPQAEELESLSLLEELAQDTETAGLAQLTKSLIAAMNVPMHTYGASELPLGGVSDITNKGNYDKLLLSELAQEDDLLTARLVNNEALYLRRESPPSKPERERVILLDTTMKMWGMPRPFALSAALALSENKKQVSEVSAFALKGMTFDPLSISTKKGVLEALNHLAPALHCGVALESFLRKAPNNETTDYVFISDADAMSHPNFRLIFNQQKHLLRFLVVINRAGDLQFFELTKGETKLINKSKFDLNELLFFIKKPTKKDDFDKKIRDLSDEEMPAFLYNDPTPLLFPGVNLELDIENNLHIKDVGILVITKTQRVLFFKNRDKGAIEILMSIEKGEYKIGYVESKKFYILVYNKEGSLLTLYELHVALLTVKKYDYAHRIDDIDKIVFKNQSFYVLGQKGNIIIALFDTIQIFEYGNYEELFDKLPNNDLKYNRRLVNRGYSILQRLKHIYINRKGCISFENFYIDLNERGETALMDNSTLPTIMKDNYQEKQLLKEDFEVKALPSNQQIKFYKVEWADGSVAMLDSRGFLHLKSSDTNIPEMTIVLVAGKLCTCWSADGFYTGNPYFMPDTDKIISGRIFYKHYIQAFISELEHYDGN
jgi:MoxR-vWA-beta-propeller ternary system domain bpX0/MoxR-vWA-beta-propeller ternary system domain bpX1